MSNKVIGRTKIEIQKIVSNRKGLYNGNIILAVMKLKLEMNIFELHTINTNLANDLGSDCSTFTYPKHVNKKTLVFHYVEVVCYSTLKTRK